MIVNSRQNERLSTVGALLSAALMMALTGELPENMSLDSEPLMVGDSSVSLEPLAQQFPAVIKAIHRSGVKWNYWHTYVGPFKPRQFLYDRFGMDWTYEIQYLLEMDVMPSAILRGIAIRMANGDLDTAQRFLDCRTTQNGFHKICHETSVVSCLATKLWRYCGNPDVLWDAMREEMARCSPIVEAKDATNHRKTPINKTLGATGGAA